MSLKSMEELLLVRLKQLLKSRACKVAFPEAFDSRVQVATKKLMAEGVLDSFQPFSEEGISGKGESLGKKIEGGVYEVLKERKREQGKVLSEEILRKKASSPLYQAVYLLSQERVDCAVAGCSYTTKEVILAGLDLLGLHAPLVSSYFLMDREASEGQESFRALFSDCAVVAQPDAEQLALIAEETLRSWKSLSFLFPGEEPAVAFLSFATHGSAGHESVTRVAKAYEIFSKRNPEVLCDGPLQFDAAFDLTVRKKKCSFSKLQEARANLYIFPDLNSGNIAYKMAQRLGSCQAYGPLLQGFQKPYTDLSRGATASDIVMTTCLKLLSLSSPS